MSPLTPSQSFRTLALDEVFSAAVGVASDTSAWCDAEHAVNVQALTSQTIYCVAVPYRRGQVVTNIGWYIAQLAAGVTPTGIFCGLADATGKLLAQSANVAASAVWTATLGLFGVALAAPYTVTADGLYYHVILENGAFGTTVLGLGRAAQLGGTYQVAGVGSRLAATGGVAQTALPANGSSVVLASAGQLPLYSFST